MTRSEEDDVSMMPTQDQTISHLRSEAARLRARVIELEEGIRTHRHTMTAGTTDMWRDCANCEERDGELWSLLDVDPEMLGQGHVLAAEVTHLREIVAAVEGLSLKCANGREVGGCTSCRPCLVWSLIEGERSEK